MPELASQNSETSHKSFSFENTDLQIDETKKLRKKRSSSKSKREPDVEIFQISEPSYFRYEKVRPILTFTQ